MSLRMFRIGRKVEVRSRAMQSAGCDETLALRHPLHHGSDALLCKLNRPVLERARTMLYEERRVGGVKILRLRLGFSFWFTLL
jgi:hypothetical protein